MVDEQHPETDVQQPENKVEAVVEAKVGPTQEDYQELNNRYLRLAADFDNFRKRQAQEREYLFKYGSQTCLESLLPVLDNLERAQQSLSESSDPKTLYKSFDMMNTQLLETLKNCGLEKMNVKGQLFDPERHEAMAQVEDAGVPDNTLLEVYQDGYCYHDRVLRPAKVVVSLMPQQNEPSSSGFEPSKFESDKNPFQTVPQRPSEQSGNPSA